MGPIWTGKNRFAKFFRFCEDIWLQSSKIGWLRSRWLRRHRNFSLGKGVFQIFKVIATGCVITSKHLFFYTIVPLKVFRKCLHCHCGQRLRQHCVHCPRGQRLRTISAWSMTTATLSPRSQRLCRHLVRVVNNGFSRMSALSITMPTQFQRSQGLRGHTIFKNIILNLLLL